jgi:glutaminyl-tRNA synthetase
MYNTKAYSAASATSPLASTKIKRRDPSLKDAKPELRYQFERLAYFALDSDSQLNRLILNRTITLKDTWAKIEKKGN